MAREKRQVPCVIYAAKSTEDTRGSIGTQLADCRLMAEREGWCVVGEFQDEGFSGFKGNRGPGLEGAKEAATDAAAEAGMSCMLLVQHSDRLARGDGLMADHLAEIYFAMRRVGVCLRSVQDDSNLDDAIRAVLIGERNTEDSRRKSEAVRDGKARQFERGERLGGPVPDGLALSVERDAADRVIARRYGPDHERAPVVERIFELSEEGHGDTAIAKQLNADGLRTKSGKPWSRRNVQDKILNPLYAGRVARHRGKQEQEVVESTNVEALIDPDRYDRIVAARVSRDRAKARGKDGLRKGDRGRPTTRYALAKLAVCDRCGAGLYASTSPYKRKDGTQRRSYLCANVHAQTGLCDQPRLDAELIDAAVVEYLDQLFIDFDAWLAEIEGARGSHRRAVESELAAAEKDLERKRKGELGIQDRYMTLMESGDKKKAAAIERALDRAQDQRDELERRVRFLRGEVARADESVPTDALLDAYNSLAESVRGGDGSDTMGKLNQRLRTKFAEFRIDRVDEETVGILPVLHPSAVDLSWSALYAAWEADGEPTPTPEQEAEHDALGRVTEPIWAKSPAAKAMHVALKERGTNTHE